MKVGILFICDYCVLPIAEGEGTTVNIEHRGTETEFHYHNRTNQDCLAQKIQELKKRFSPLFLVSDGKPAA